MNLISQFKEDLKQALVRKDSGTASSLRMLLASIKNEEIAKGKELSDVDALAIVKSEVKKIKDSIQQFGAAGRDDLVESEEKDLAVLERYLPEQLSEEDIRKLVIETISSVSAQGMKDMGRVIGAIMAKHSTEVDGAVVSKVVKEELLKL